MTHRPKQGSAGDEIGYLLSRANGVKRFQKFQSLLLNPRRLFITALRF